MDSVSLMKIARDVRELAQIEDVALVMGTDANKRLLEQLTPLEPEIIASKATDLIVMIRAEDDIACHRAHEQVDMLMNAGVSTQSDSVIRKVQTLKSALKTLPNANIVLISLAAQYAVAEAWQALQNKKHVFLFSDNISVEDELALKQYAVEHNLLLMGPGAGTAIINQVGLGFSNEVLVGQVGIVSASGTGLQEVTTLLSKQGVGISQAIGVGSRDLSEDIGGLMCFQAIDALKADSETEIIMVISKLPSPRIANRVMDTLADTGKPAVVIFMTLDQPPASESVYVANTLHEAALATVSIIRGQSTASIQSARSQREEALKDLAISLRVSLTPQQKYGRGLFSGGTLCEEAMRIWLPYMGDVWSNVPFSSDWQLRDSHSSIENSAIDLGEEEFTVGRPHPMIDNELRSNRILAEAEDETVAVIQLDFVLGYGAHENPAQELAPVIRQARDIAKARGQKLIFIACLVGTESDPQNLAEQKRILEDAGVMILDSNAEASLLTAFIVGGLA